MGEGALYVHFQLKAYSLVFSVAEVGRGVYSTYSLLRVLDSTTAILLVTLNYPKKIVVKL